MGTTLTTIKRTMATTTTTAKRPPTPRRAELQRRDSLFFFEVLFSVSAGAAEDKDFCKADAELAVEGCVQERI